MSVSNKDDSEKRKCLSLDERILIQEGLDTRMSIAEIAVNLQRYPTTISREIKLNANVKGTLHNDCANKNECKRKHVCGNMECKKTCRYSTCICKKYCKDYVKTICPIIEKPPYVCNGCAKRGFCDKEKFFYKASKAEEQSINVRHTCNTGFDLTPEQITDINNMVSPMIKNGNSVYHVIKTLGPKLPVSASTLYRLIDASELDARNIDLRIKVKLRPRKQRKMKNEQMPTIRKMGRMWADYLAYMEKHDDVSVVQMDCVEGARSSSKALLTLHWADIGFQIAILLPSQSAECVVKALDDLEKGLGTDTFQELFPVILTDNGTEFMAIEDMERSCLKRGIKRTKLFFCEPHMANEKGACENNHRLIRDIIPKGTDLDQFTQEDITLCMSHVNSILRKKIDGFSPVVKAKASFPEKFFKVTGIREIPPDEVIRRPSLVDLHYSNTGKYVKS